MGGSSHILSIWRTSCRLEIPDGDSDWKPDTWPYFQSQSAEAGLEDALRGPAGASVHSEACCSATCCMDVKVRGKACKCHGSFSGVSKRSLCRRNAARLWASAAASPGPLHPQLAASLHPGAAPAGQGLASRCPHSCVPVHVHAAASGVLSSLVQVVRVFWGLPPAAKPSQVTLNPSHPPWPLSSSGRYSKSLTHLQLDL